MIKRADKNDAHALAALAIQLWRDNDPDELADDFRELIRNGDAVCFLKYIGGRPIAFAQCQLRRDYVEGTVSSPVGYLEGIFVSEAYRRNGYAAELLAECEKWAKEKGCSEFASDCELDHADSQGFHTAAGFHSSVQTALEQRLPAGRMMSSTTPLSFTTGTTFESRKKPRTTESPVIDASGLIGGKHGTQRKSDYGNRKQAAHRDSEGIP